MNQADVLGYAKHVLLPLSCPCRQASDIPLCDFVTSSFQSKFCELSILLARSSDRPQCFCSAALVGGCSDVTIPYLLSE
eukprot:1160864-Pelagomonas_calceolata.AAC.6